MASSRKSVVELRREINHIQYITFVLSYLFQVYDSAMRLELARRIRILERDKETISPKSSNKEALAFTSIIPELQEVRLQDTLNEILQYEKEEQRQLLAKLGITHLTVEARHLFQQTFINSLTGLAYVQMFALEKIMNIRKLAPQRLLANSLVSFDVTNGMNWHTPERWFYRDMCWHYNTFTTAIEARLELERKSALDLQVPMTHVDCVKLYAVASQAWRHLRNLSISSITFVESAVNALYFEFLYALRYEDLRVQLRAEIEDSKTSKNRKELLQTLFGESGKGTRNGDEMTFTSLDWKLRYLPMFLSGAQKNMPAMDRPPFDMLLAINKLWRNAYIHPSYERQPTPRLPKKLKEMLNRNLGSIPSKLAVIIDSSFSVEAQRSFATIAVDHAVEAIEKVYEMSFGANHGFAWWVKRRGVDGRFPDPDDWEVLKEQFHKQT